MPKVHFVTPLAAKSSVKDWQLTCHLLRQTLASLENQTIGNFTSTVCCHDVPEFARDLDARFRFVECPTSPPPDAQSISGTNSGVADMMAKRDTALFYARPAKEDFVVVLDADDLFSKDLVGILETTQDADGVTFDVGYEFCHMSKRLFLRRDMVGRTSSSFALSGWVISAPKSLSKEDREQSLFHTVWHSNVAAYLKNRQLKHIKLSEPTVVYRTNTGLNMSDFYRANLFRAMRHRIKFLIGRKITAEDWNVFRLQ